ncbi:beta-ketoacyl synthase N-terminal-like domain-containing protein [Nonomuraea sp. NPDC059194]|uniref:beta-ketoacyl synthase N-terminal-like domain-containing protein n=1 Tax=Nonomuraea sp. NPDC059194 TaxID=3346764 RepID=UPI0036ABB83B
MDVLGEGEIRRFLTERISARCGTVEVDPDRPLQEFGLSSRDAMGIAGELAELVGRELPPTLVWEHPTINRLATALSPPAPHPHSAPDLHSDPRLHSGPGPHSGPAGPHFGPAEGPSSAPVVGAEGSRTARVAGIAERPSEPIGGRSFEPIAVVGVGCRLPGAEGPEAFWDLLVQGRDAVRTVPEGRWERFGDGTARTAEALDRTTRHGGFLDDIEGFDAEFFGIPPGEAATMDPQQRLLLETAWDALEHGGIAPRSLRGSRTAAFVGISGNEYAHLTTADPASVDAWTATGAAFSIAANRLSYLLDLRGPSMAVDTACSSSLVAIHLAVNSLRAGESDLALAAGVNLLLSPVVTMAFDQAGGTAPDGRCKAFDASADGMVRAEGCGVVVLKRLSDALRDNDRVLAVVVASAVNQDGRSNGLVAPNPDAQQDLLRTVYSGLDRGPDYIEAHGTGTFLGDPIEAGAIAAALPGPVLVGSVKTNLGHLEAAAGVTGFIKTVLSLHHGLIPPSLHFHTPNPHIPWHALTLVTEPTPWPRPDARAGVSSFGFGGTNAHLALDAFAPPRRTTSTPATRLPAPSDDMLGHGWPSAGVLVTSAVSPDHGASPAGPVFVGDVASDRGVSSPGPLAPSDVMPDHGRSASHLLVLSDVSADRVRAQATDLAAWLTGGEEPGGAAEHGDRGSGPQGGGWLGDVAYTLARRAGRGRVGAAVVGRSAGELAHALRNVEPVPTGGKGPVWVFSGYGAQWPGMGRDLYAAEPVFRDAIDEVAPLVRVECDVELRDWAAQGVAHLQPVIFAVQIALSRLWTAYGIRPTAVIGHSMGEVAAAVVAGGLGLHDGVRVICRRARLLGSLGGGGSMAVLEVAAEEVPSDLHIAVYSSPTQTVVTGDEEGVARFAAEVEASGRYAKVLTAEGAGHSPQVKPLQPRLRAELEAIVPGRPAVPFYSTVLDDPRETPTFVPAYWAAGIRRPVRLMQAVRAAADDGYTVFTEIGPHPVLAAALRDSLPRGVLVTHSLTKPRPSDPAGRNDAVIEGSSGAPFGGVGGRHEGGPGVGERCGEGSSGAHAVVDRGRTVAEPLSGGRGAVVRGFEEQVARVAVAVPPRLDGAVVDVPRARWRRERHWVAERARPEGGHPLLGVHVETPAGHSWSTVLDDLSEAPWHLEYATWHRQGHAVLPVEAVARLALAALGDGAAPGKAAAPCGAAGRTGAVRGGAAGSSTAGLAGVAVGGVVPGGVAGPSGAGLGAMAVVEDVALYGLLPLPARVSVTRVGGRVEVHAKDAAGVWKLYGSAGGGSSVNALERIGRFRVDGTAEGIETPEIQETSIPVRLADKLVERIWTPAPLADDQAAAREWLILADEGDPRADRLASFLPAGPDGEPLVLVPDNPDPSTVLLLLARLVRDGRRLTIVTERAQAVVDGERGEPAAASLRGVVRVLALEHPELRASLIDVDDLSVLARELAHDAADDEVAWRDGVRYAARLRRAELPEPPAQTPPVVREGGGYLITGGYGSLGLLVARWLIERGAGRVVLNGRSGPSTEVAELLSGRVVRSATSADVAGRAVINGAGRSTEVAELSGRVVRSGTSADVAELLSGRVLRSRTSADVAGRALINGAGKSTEVAGVVEVVTGDLAEEGTAERLVAAVTEGGVRLCGVVHAAGVLDDRLVADLTQPSVERVWAAKATGGRRLHEATRDLDLDWWVAFSSAASLLGSPGQAAYAMANAYLDALCDLRRSEGLAAVSISWGTWAGANPLPAVTPLTPEEGIEALEALLQRKLSAGVVRLDPAAAVAAFPGVGRMPYFSMVVEGAGERRTDLGDLPPEEALRVIGARVRERVAGVLGLDAAWPGEGPTTSREGPTALGEGRRWPGGGRGRPGDGPGWRGEGSVWSGWLGEGAVLTELGLDSLAATRLRGVFEHDFGVALPAGLLLRGGTLGDVVRALAAELGIEGIRPVDAGPVGGRAVKQGVRSAGVGGRMGGSGEVGPRDAAERLVVRVASEVVGRELGVTEAVPAGVLPALEREVGCRVDGATLAEVADGVRALDEREAERGIVRPLTPGPDPARPSLFHKAPDPGRVSLPHNAPRHARPLFLVHPAGGTTGVYLRLASLLAAPVFGLERVDGGRDIPERAAAYVEAITATCPAPYRLGGWSFGGIMSFEIARQLGDAVELVAMIDSGLPDRLDPAKRTQAHARRYADFAAYLRDTYGAAVALTYDDLKDLDERRQLELTEARIEESGVLANLSPAILHHQRTSHEDTLAIERYRCEPYEGRVVLYRSTEPTPWAVEDVRYAHTGDPARGFAPYAKNLEIVPIHGSHHLNLLDPPHVEIVAAHLRGLL